MTQPPAPVFLDTNVILRTLDDGDDQASQDCRSLMRRLVAGDLACWTTHLVLAELAWTLRSLFRAPRERIAAALIDLVDIESLQIERKDMVREAIQSYAATSVDFIDAYNAAAVRRRGQASLCSYDRDFERLGLERIEPAALFQE